MSGLRTASHGVSTHTSGGAGAAPHWVRLTRVGNVLTGYRSTDGITWTTVGSETIAMAATTYIGLAVTSHLDGTINSSTFDNVSAAHPTIGQVLRRALYVAEATPLHVFGLSHFLVLRKRG